MKAKRFFGILATLALVLLISCTKSEDKPKPTAGFTASKNSAMVDESIQFTNSSKDATSYSWSFGDGSTSTQESPSKAYSSAGTFTVTLVATGPGGSASSTLQITINAAPVAGFTPSLTSALVGDNILFTNSSTNSTTYAWDFGDGTNSTQQAPTKAYTEAGTYTVTLTATGAGGSATSTAQITVSTMAVYFTDTSDELLERVILNADKTLGIVKELPAMSGVGLAYDATNGKIYMSDFYDADTPNGKIWSMNLDGSGATALATGILDPYGIALDLEGGKVYWVDDAGNVSRANLDGTSAEIGLVNIVDGGLRAIALDKAHNKMYFFDAANDVLYWANMDGTGVAPLITGIYGYAICVDAVNGKIYYDEEYTPALMRANLDGTGIEQIYKNPDAAVGKSRIYGIVIDNENNKLYWANRDAGSLYSSNLDGTSMEVLKSGLTSPRGIFLKK
jgi:PKD repeat protein